MMRWKGKVALVITELHKVSSSDIPQKREMGSSYNNKASTLIKIRFILIETA